MIATVAGQPLVGMAFTEPTGFRAQMGEPGSEPIPSDQTIAQNTPHTDITVSTTGEYFESLRPLLKRFCKIAQIGSSDTVSYTPASFNNYTGTDLNTGNRAWATPSGSGNLLRESWLNLISYLFRFYSGSTRTKVFIPFNVQATTSLTLNDTLHTEFGLEQHDPSFVQQGVINNAVETTCPYYTQHRARTVGDDANSLIAKTTFSFTGNRTHDLYEAGGDDANFWFMVGPPVMRPWDVDRTPLTIIEPIPDA